MLYIEADPLRAGADESCVRGEAIRDALSRWVGFSRFIDDGRIENEYHIVERSMQENPLRRFHRRNGQSSLR
ncbi:hypothetical protein IE4872_PC00295 (plasmid) [Rhizobium gallicum]|uniref:Uncharacterized protein n=1 Tax=Rhizobium gallicum TaxID=56730 RepID=A0A1L5NR25_9HYPH|nr:hypothetical protein IE4872_PC00295 [Rhizobium gallicum]